MKASFLGFMLLSLLIFFSILHCQAREDPPDWAVIVKQTNAPCNRAAANEKWMKTRSASSEVFIFCPGSRSSIIRMLKCTVKRKKQLLLLLDLSCVFYLAVQISPVRPQKRSVQALERVARFTVVIKTW